MELEQLVRGADILVMSLARKGVRKIYGVTGGASLESFDALGTIGQEYGIQLIDTVKEDGAVFAAQGHSRSSEEEIGVALTTSGPGATNALTPVTDSKLDSIPILLLTGQVPSFMLGKDAFQEAPVTEMSSHVTKASYLVRDLKDLPDIIAEAFYLARNGRPGPVHVDITKDATQAEGVIENVFRPPHQRLDSPDDLAYKVDLVYEQLKKSKKTIIYAGGGVISSGAHKELLELSEMTGIPVTTTVMGLGGFPGTHRQSLGMLGMHGTAYANFAINGSPLGNYHDGADFVLAIGARFDDRVTGKASEFAKNAYILHVDIDPKENGKNRTPNLFVHSDAKKFLEILNSRLRQEAFRPNYSEWWQHLESLKNKFPLTYDKNLRDDNGNEIPAQHVIEELWKRVHSSNPIVTTGVGQHQMWAAQYFLVDSSRKFLTSAGLGVMGFGLPATIGAQVANPDKLVIDLDGDRSFYMTKYELETIARFGLPIKIVVFDNGGHGMVRQWQDMQYNSRYVASRYRNIDFTQYARLFEDDKGNKVIGSKRIKRLEEVEPALVEMLNHRGPYLLHVDTRYEWCFPIIPSGKTIREIRLQK